MQKELMQTHSTASSTATAYPSTRGVCCIRLIMLEVVVTKASCSSLILGWVWDAGDSRPASELLMRGARGWESRTAGSCAHAAAAGGGKSRPAPRCLIGSVFQLSNSTSSATASAAMVSKQRKQKQMQTWRSKRVRAAAGHVAKEQPPVLWCRHHPLHDAGHKWQPHQSSRRK